VKVGSVLEDGVKKIRTSSLRLDCDSNSAQPGEHFGAVPKISSDVEDKVTRGDELAIELKSRLIFAGPIPEVPSLPSHSVPFDEVPVNG